MWIVRLALNRPYTIAVMAFLMMLGGVMAIRSMQTDIFPKIDIPVVNIVWAYPGLSAQDMERRVVINNERGISSQVQGVARIESSSIPGVGLLRVYFQPGTDLGQALAQISAVSSTALRQMPPGMQPPVLLPYNASNLPVLHMIISSKTMGEDAVADYTNNFLRLRLFTIPGLQTPGAYGGKQRQINIDIDPAQLTAKGLSAADVISALQSSNVILPAGTARMGQTEYNISLNASPSTLDQFYDIPVKVINGQTIKIEDIGKISDSFADPTNIVRINGKHASYLSILRKSSASTLTIVESSKNMIPKIKEIAPEGLEIGTDFDQSIFVSAAIENVLHEMGLAIFLVGLMIFGFLGNWRNVFIVVTSIPLAILTAIVVLDLTGNSLNIMTLGGLSLAVGMLVDDATVAIESIHRHLSMGKSLVRAILDGAADIATPALVATLSICIVFIPVLFITGPAGYLFIPMALSVVVAMLTSYVLSRTLVPLLSRLMLSAGSHDTHLTRFDRWRDNQFERLQNAYGRSLRKILKRKGFVLTGSLVIVILTVVLVTPHVGTDFFPTTDTGFMKLHFRAPFGTRIEETEKYVERLEDAVKKIVPPEELGTISANIGVPIFFNLAYVQSDNVNGMDAEIMISLKKGHKPTEIYRNKIREVLDSDFPGTQSYFQTADMVGQVLNFGLSSPIDLQVEVNDYNKGYEMAKVLRDSLKKVAGLKDVTIKQVLDYPTLKVDVDRIRAAQVGLSQRDVASNLLVNLSSSGLFAPSYFLNPANNVNYVVVVKSPMTKIQSVSDLMNLPLTTGAAAGALNSNSTIQPTDVPRQIAQTVRNVSDIKPSVMPSQINHENIQRVLNVSANVEGRDLGSVSADIERIVKGLGQLPKGFGITVRGQGQVMNESFTNMAQGLVLAILLVYVLMVVLFQSLKDPLIVLVAIPGALTGIILFLYATNTTINVVSLMGSIMAVGIAASNATLLVSYANDLRMEGYSILKAVIEAGKTRLRPILMTALAMILGMIPMAIGLGEGSEQNAPLARAVIGGLIIATLFTLFVVPAVYAGLYKGKAKAKVSLLEDQQDTSHVVA